MRDFSCVSSSSWTRALKTIVKLTYILYSKKSSQNKKQKRIFDKKTISDKKMGKNIYILRSTEYTDHREKSRSIQ
jgi:hypothetical protein